MERNQADFQFCQTFLNTFDPQRAATISNLPDGFAALDSPSVQSQLDQMRSVTATQLQRDDILRRLAQLAFGRANDAIKLALSPHEVNPDTLDLSALSECKISDKGVEIKLLDRVHALEILCKLLDSNLQTSHDLCQILADSSPEGVWKSE